MNIEPVGNRDRCGRCGSRHGGNNNLCSVHGAVSPGCCEPSCNPIDYVKVGTRNKKYPTLAPTWELKLRSGTRLEGLTLEAPYSHQDDGTGRYKPEYVERYIAA